MTGSELCCSNVRHDSAGQTFDVVYGTALWHAISQILRRWYIIGRTYLVGSIPNGSNIQSRIRSKFANSYALIAQETAVLSDLPLVFRELQIILEMFSPDTLFEIRG
jgi:hypothetical protein